MARRRWFPALRNMLQTPGPQPDESKTITWTGGYTSTAYAGTTNIWGTEGRADGWDIGRVVTEGYERVIWVYKAIDTMGKHAARLPLQIGRGLTEDGEFEEVIDDLSAYLLHRELDSALGTVLQYLVRLLTEPLVVDGHQVPGWWAATGPSDTPEPGDFPHGHANFGLAHGVAGPLALLALARRAGHTVAGQDDALAAGITHLTTWAQPLKGGGTGWPECLSLDAYRHGPQPDAAPARASWCYGTPGIARAPQLAALALNNDTARHLAEHTALQAATDPRHAGQIVDTSLCHGWAGLVLATERIASDSALPDLHDALPALRERLVTETQHHPAPEHTGLLTGAPGVLLAQHTLTTAPPVDPEWETCLLLTP